MTIAKSNFEKDVYKILKIIPKGKVVTYAGIAKALGNPRAYRAVGNALNKNPDAPRVPCHRVVKSDGSLGGYALGEEKKIEILRKEGIVLEGKKIKEFEKKLFLIK